MLLPSDVARLVLGYLQQEKLLATCREFILESSDLKEYAEHCTEDGFIPACLLSLCGKNLTTILNEYVAMKTKGGSGADLRSLVTSGKTHGNGMKLHQGKFKLGIRKRFFTARVRIEA